MNTRRGAAVLGSPIAHSLSPMLHRAAYADLGLTDWSYRAVECREGELAGVLRQLDDEGLAGVSLTMPLKRAVLPMLATIDDAARAVGAVNTVLFGETSGDWRGANTDIAGIVSALKEAGLSAPGPEAAGLAPVAKAVLAPAAVLGSGATAASAIAALAELGAGDVTLYARRPAAAAPVRDVAATCGVRLDVAPWESAARAAGAEVVVSTVPAGATDLLAGLLPAAVHGVLLDVVYVPWPTPLASAWSSRGGSVVGGLVMLVAQAAEQVRLMTGRDPAVDAMRRAGEAALR